MYIFQNFFGKYLSRYLQKTIKPATVGHTPLAVLHNTLQPGDVLLVEGNQRVSVAIQYLTQSTWSHAAVYVGPHAQTQEDKADPPCLIEADLQNGVQLVPLSKYDGLSSRICRPCALRPEDTAKLLAYLHNSLGRTYDLKHIWDLLRYLIRQPPVPQQWRRRMLALGSGDPTRAICSSLIAEAFQHIKYPILPEVQHRPGAVGQSIAHEEEVLHIRHHSLFTPRDFDLSPYFKIVKPTLEKGFDYKGVVWSEKPSAV